jgi:FkbM family methyltransferase
MKISRDLIFDLGVFDGQDSRYYLDKGFRVVAVEAHPEYAMQAKTIFASEIAEGRYTLIDRAVSDRDDQKISFFMLGAQSSTIKELAERNGTSRHATVSTISIATLIARHGVPYYLKCDIEGADDGVVQQLTELDALPRFLSIETPSADSIPALQSLGYDRFQIVNQTYHKLTRAPSPAREGRYIDVRFGVEHSGLFGRDLPERFWLTAAQTIEAFALRNSLLDERCNPLRRAFWRRYGRLTDRRWIIPSGWTDLHACHHSALKELA